MKIMLAIMIVVLLLVGTLAFTLPTAGLPPTSAQPSSISTINSGGNPVQFISCTTGPCPCPSC